MEDLEVDLERRAGFTEEIRPEDSVSQTFHYADPRIPVALHESQLMEIDQTIDDTASSALSAPPS